MVLTNQQREELNKAIIEYLVNSNYSETAKAFSTEAQVVHEVASKASISDILEKKWVSISRLQKRIYELESKIEQQNEEMAGMTKMKRTNLSPTEIEQLLPKASPKLKGFSLQRDNFMEKQQTEEKLISKRRLNGETTVYLFSFDLKPRQFSFFFISFQTSST